MTARLKDVERTPESSVYLPCDPRDGRQHIRQAMAGSTSSVNTWRRALVQTRPVHGHDKVQRGHQEQALAAPEYRFHDRDVLVTACGRICIYRKNINVSTVLAGQRLGIKEVDEGIWLVSFIDY